MTQPALTVHTIGHLDPESLPDGPAIILTGSRDAIKAAAALFGEKVQLVPLPEEGA
jgi:hypothetical protein